MAIPRLSPQVTGIDRVLEPDRVRPGHRIRAPKIATIITGRWQHLCRGAGAGFPGPPRSATRAFSLDCTPAARPSWLGCARLAWPAPADNRRRCHLAPGPHPGPPSPGDRLRREYRLGPERGHGDPDQYRDQQGRQVHKGRELPASDRDHPERQDRLRPQLRLEHGHADRHRDQQDRQGHHGRELPPGHRVHPERQDCLRREHRLGQRDPDQHRHQQGRQGHHGRQRPPAPSRSPRTARPPTWSPTRAS